MERKRAHYKKDTERLFPKAFAETVEWPVESEDVTGVGDR